MDRIFLDMFLKSGPARKYDVRYFSIAVTKKPREEREYLFKTFFLNTSIIFKCMITDDYKIRRDEKPVITLVYLPYDLIKPEEGGESFIFTPERFLKFYEYKRRSKTTDHTAYEHDLELLQVLDSIPTFSPLIVELAFERKSISIPKAYLDLTDEMRAKLKAQLKSRIRPLIVAAYGGAGLKVEKAVEEMASKLFTLSNVNEVMPLVQALQLPPEHAVDFLASWIGITYFEYEYSTLQAELVTFANWLATKASKTSNLTAIDREQVEKNIKFISTRLKKDWSHIFKLSTEYRDVYNNLIYKSDIPMFRSFLLRCQKSYWELGDLLGRFEQTATAWRTFKIASQEDKIPGATLIEFLALLRALHNTHPPTGGDSGPALPIEGGFPNIVPNLF